MADQVLKKILCVEDEPDIRAVVKLTLESIGGFTVELCESGHEALSKAPEFGPDLIILDVMMPDISGPATLEALRKLPALRKTPVVFMTAKTQAQEIQRFEDAGALGVITKPFDPMTLPTQITEIWTSRNVATGD